MSYVSRQLAIIPSSRSMLSRDKRLPLDTCNTSVLQGIVFGNQFSTFDSPRDHPQGIHSCAPQRERGSVPQATGTGTLIARGDKQNTDTIPMPTFARRPSNMSFAIPVDFFAEFYGWTEKTANIGTAIRQIPKSPIILGLEDTIQKSRDYLF